MEENLHLLGSDQPEGAPTPTPPRAQGGGRSVGAGAAGAKSRVIFPSRKIWDVQHQLEERKWLRFYVK